MKETEIVRKKERQKDRVRWHERDKGRKIQRQRQTK